MNAIAFWFTVHVGALLQSKPCLSQWSLHWPEAPDTCQRSKLIHGHGPKLRAVPFTCSDATNQKMYLVNNHCDTVDREL